MQEENATEALPDSCDGLAKILNKFGPSVKEKFERCSDTEWCLAEAVTYLPVPKQDARQRTKARCNGSAARSLVKQSRLARKVLKKLVCMKAKTSKVRKESRQARQTKANPTNVNTLICRGGNTPASSRPSSMSMTMEHIERDCRSSEFRLNTESAATSISVG